MIAIAAMAENRAIGKDGKLPWPSIREDFQHFKTLTLDKHILVGKNTFEHLPRLKRRKIWVMSHSMPANMLNPEEMAQEIYHPYTIVNDINNVCEDIIICGGASIYKQFLPKCDTLYLTVVKGAYSADTFMPLFEHLFDLQEVILSNEKITILKYRRNTCCR